jgi:hypothetical protein
MVLRASTGNSACWIGQIAKRYNNEGLDAMHNPRHRVSRPMPTLLTSAQIEEPRQALACPSRTAGAGAGE